MNNNKENEKELRIELIKDITINRIKIAEYIAKGFDREIIKNEKIKLGNLEEQIKVSV